jgi:hypothetical protein
MFCYRVYHPVFQKPENTFLKLDVFPSGEGGKPSAVLCPLERLGGGGAVSIIPNRVGPAPSPEDKDSSNFRNVVFSSFKNTRGWWKSTNPVLGVGVGVLLGYRASLWDPWPDLSLLFFLRLTITLVFFPGRPLWRENGSVVYSAVTH